MGSVSDSIENRPAEPIPEVRETWLAHPVVVVLGDVTTIDSVSIIGCERDADVPLAELAVIMILVLAVWPPGAESHPGALQISLLAHQAPVVGHAQIMPDGV
jgi:hypothetical protein